jgi:transcriptional regulator with XRE-family HTH domain
MELNRIREVIDRKGIKQTWLAEKLGKSFNMVNAYVCNRKQSSMEILHQIAELLDVSVTELIVDNKKRKDHGSNI